MSAQHDDIIEAEVNGPQVVEEQGGLVLAAEVLPAGLPIVPLRPRPAFPAMLVPLVVNDPRQMEAVKRAVDSPARAVGLVLVRDNDAPDGPDNLHRVGVAGKIVKVLHADDDSIQFLVNTLERFSVEEVSEADDGLFARVRYHYGTELSVNPELKAYSMAVLATLKELIQINPLYSEELKLFLNRSSLDDPGKLADFAANLTSADGQELQQ
ncbi:MAG TPA: LON peptidase substrate-binding domain-containing protein, partial [Geobacteraceae bacterium]